MSKLKIIDYFAPFNNKRLDSKIIDSYKDLLRSNLISAFKVPYQNFDNENFHASHNCCHENTAKYCQINPKYTQIRGWICISNEGIQTITLASHSIIKSKNGEFFDITPSSTPQIYKFLPAFLDDLSFDKLVIHLYSETQRTNLHIQKPDSNGL